MNNMPKGCPLIAHRTGQWAKTIKDNVYYFGKDLDATRVRWVEEKDYLLAGLPVPKNDGKPNVEELGNLFHTRGFER